MPGMMPGSDDARRDDARDDARDAPWAHGTLIERIERLVQKKEIRGEERNTTGSVPPAVRYIVGIRLTV